VRVVRGHRSLVESIVQSVVNPETQHSQVKLLKRTVHVCQSFHPRLQLWLDSLYEIDHLHVIKVTTAFGGLMIMPLIDNRILSQPC